MRINQYLAVMLIGLAISNLFQSHNRKKNVGVIRWLYSSYSGNFAGFSFLISTLAFLLSGMILGESPYLAFCSTSLIAEGVNIKWRDFRSSSYAVFVGIETLLFQYWQADTTTMLVSAVCIAVGATYIVRRMYNQETKIADESP